MNLIIEIQVAVTLVAVAAAFVYMIVDPRAN
jgi:hypothetical protein